MKRIAVCLLVIIVVTSTGCIKTHITPIEAKKIGLICIRDNPISFREDFLSLIRDEFRKNLIKTRLLEHGQDEKECFCIMEYTASWEWDRIFYLSYAKIEVYKNDLLIGSAEYDATNAGYAFTKYIKDEIIISQLIEALLNLN